MSHSAGDPLLLDLTAQIVSAHVARNKVQPEALPSLINSVFKMLLSIDKDEPDPSMPEPAVPIRKSVFADYIVCLEDGRKMKVLKGYLLRAFGMTPGQYRKRWGLPSDYPMVAPNYAERRSKMAKSAGLGRRDHGEQAQQSE